MSLVLDGRRVNGRWVRGSVQGDNRESSVISAAWEQAMRQAGLVLDHAPDLAVPVRDGDQALDSAYQEATDRRDAEHNKLAEAERLAAG